MTWAVLAEYPEIYRIARAPHQSVFPGCAAVVHHSGAGTTQSATLAGCPSVVVEHASDQPLWGEVLYRAVISSKLLHRRNVTATKLARAIRIVLDSPEMSKKAKMIGNRMKQEDGVKQAIELINRLDMDGGFKGS